MPFLTLSSANQQNDVYPPPEHSLCSSPISGDPLGQCPSNTRCFDLDTSECLICYCPINCTYGKEANATCFVADKGIKCKGEKKFKKEFICRYTQDINDRKTLGLKSRFVYTVQSRLKFVPLICFQILLPDRKGRGLHLQVRRVCKKDNYNSIVIVLAPNLTVILWPVPATAGPSTGLTAAWPTTTSSVWEGETSSGKKNATGLEDTGKSLAQKSILKKTGASYINQMSLDFRWTTALALSVTLGGFGADRWVVLWNKDHAVRSEIRRECLNTIL